MKLNTEAQVKAAERVLRLVWVIVAGAVLFSMFTVTPLVERVTPEGWAWSAPVLSLIVDAAVVIVVRVDAIIATLGGRPGGWSAVLRWLTGAFTLALNIGDSALKGDMVGVGVHMVAPVLLIVSAEAQLTYRRAITAAVARIEQERAAREQAERERRERLAREREESARAERERVERERREREDRERADREREAYAARQAERERVEREQSERAEQREHEQRMAREEREHADRVRAQEQQHADRLAREQADREREDRERLARERREQARERQARTVANTPREHPANTAREHPANAAADGDKMSESEARGVVANTPSASIRDLARITGWSLAWVQKTRKELTPAG